MTVHPSYLLRLPDEATKQEAYEAFVSDLRRIHDLAQADLDTGELPLAVAEARHALAAAVRADR